MRHLHLQHRRTPSFGRALAVALLVAAVAAHRPGEGSPFHPGNVEDDEDLLDDLEEPEPLEGDEDDDEWDDDDDELGDEEEAEPLGDDDEPDEPDEDDVFPLIVGDERIW